MNPIVVNLIVVNLTESTEPTNTMAMEGTVVMVVMVDTVITPRCSGGCSGAT